MIHLRSRKTLTRVEKVVGMVQAQTASSYTWSLLIPKAQQGKRMDQEQHIKRTLMFYIDTKCTIT